MQIYYTIVVEYLKKKCICPFLASTITDPTKYFGCELGAQTQFDLKNDRYIVNGSHDASKLQGLLDGFIKRFVLCAECSNPETILVSINPTIACCKCCASSPKQWFYYFSMKQIISLCKEYNLINYWLINYIRAPCSNCFIISISAKPCLIVIYEEKHCNTIVIDYMSMFL